MLYYICASKAEYKRIRKQGQLELIESVFDRVLSNAAEAFAGCDGRLLVFSAKRDIEVGDHIGATAFRNLSPYLPARPITAAGGYLVRRDSETPEILLIKRRGLWDLPKGKLDSGEKIPDCAVREVGEEVGIRRVSIVAPLGETVHGYVDGRRYSVKSTHWYLMTTDETTFSPEAREGITDARWFQLEEAHRRLGYGTLRKHLSSWAQTIEDYLADKEVAA